VQKVLRHKSVRSTEVYTRGYVDDLRPAMSGRHYGASA
jgi:site-specific recombinase XerD